MKRNSRRKPDFSKNPNAQARLAAGKRSDADHAGGIVAEAEHEQEVVSQAPAEETPVETPATEAAEPAAEETTETPAEESSEVPAEEAGSEEVPAEEAQSAAEQEAPQSTEDEAAEQASEENGETPKDEAEEETAPEEPAAQEAEHEAAPEQVGDYQAPEGESHDELLDKYHEAIIFGDTEQAKVLYRQLREHRFQENIHRTKSDAAAKAEEDEYVRVATEFATKHPELDRDGLEADKVLALSDIYRNTGMSAVEALKKAVADLYPAEAVAEEPKASIAVEIGKAEPEAPAAVEEEPTPEPEAPAAEEKPALIPDQSERMQQKRSTPALDIASARNQPEPPPKEPTRTDAIAQIKARRGQ